MTDKTQTNKDLLLPCPFCRGVAEFERIGNTRVSTIVSCADCGCRLESGETFNHGNTWNTRPNNPDYYVIPKSDVQALTCHPDERVSVPYLEWEALKTALTAQSDMVTIPRDVLEKAPVKPCKNDYKDGARFNDAGYLFDRENYYRNCANFLENYVLNYKAGE